MKSRTASFFDSVAESWDSTVKVDEAKIHHILSLAEIGPGDSVLDVGTGTGVLIPFLGQYVGDWGHIDAVDFSEGMLAQAEKKYDGLPNVSFIQKDVGEELLDGLYDCIIMYCVFPHLKHSLDTVECLVWNNLKPGGRLLIAFPESREAINAICSHNDGSVYAEPLCPASQLATIFSAVDNNLYADYFEENDEFYIVRIVPRD